MNNETGGQPSQGAATNQTQGASQEVVPAQPPPAPFVQSSVSMMKNSSDKTAQGKQPEIGSQRQQADRTGE